MTFSRDNLLSPQELAETFGLSPDTLADWRSQRRGPAYLSVGRKIWYPKDRVDKWLETKLKETKEDGITETERHVALPVQTRRQGIQRNHKLGRHRTKRDRSEAA
jgi:excisionase family DNA binding protein